MNNATKVVLAVIVVLLVGFGLFSIDRNDRTQGGEVTIGAIGILSGSFAGLGEGMMNAVILASEDWNRENPDRQVRLIVEDDGFDAKRGLSAYNKLVEVDKVDALINTSSPTINIIYPLVTRLDFPVSQFGEQDITATDDNIFQIQGSIPLQRKMGEYIRETEPNAKIAVASTNDSTFQRFTDAIDDGYGSKIPRHTINTDTKDVRTIAAKIVAEDNDIVIISTTYDIGAQLAKEILAYPDHPRLYFDTVFNYGEYQKILSDMTILDGSTVVSIKFEVSEEFKAAYLARFGTEAGQFSEYAYDGFMALMEAYDDDGEEWIENMKETDFQGASGRVTYDEAGLRQGEIEIKEIKGGVLVAK